MASGSALKKPRPPPAAWSPPKLSRFVICFPPLRTPLVLSPAATRPHVPPAASQLKWDPLSAFLDCQLNFIFEDGLSFPPSSAALLHTRLVPCPRPGPCHDLVSSRRRASRPLIHFELCVVGHRSQPRFFHSCATPCAGSSIVPAFECNFRLWGIAELKDMLLEAGTFDVTRALQLCRAWCTHTSQCVVWQACNAAYSLLTRPCCCVWSSQDSATCSSTGHRLVTHTRTLLNTLSHIPYH